MTINTDCCNVYHAECRYKCCNYSHCAVGHYPEYHNVIILNVVVVYHDPECHYA